MMMRLGFVGDMVIIALSAGLAWFLVSPVDAVPLYYVLLVFFATLLWPLLLTATGVYQESDKTSFLPMLFSTLSLGLILIIGLWAFKVSEDFSRLWLGSWLMLTMLSGGVARLFARRFCRWLPSKGHCSKRVAVVGAGALGEQIVARTQQHTGGSFEVVALFDDDAEKWHKVILGVPVVAADEMVSWLKNNPIDEVWLALPLRAEARLQSLLHALRYETCNIRYVPNLSSLRLLNHAPRSILGFSMLDLSVSPMSEPSQRWLKTIEDKILASIILLLISPLMLLLALGVKLSSSGPVFYRQERIGLNGTPFMMLKFRSMPVDVEKTGVQWGSADSKTNTWFGKFIRRTSLDELPQFINVLLGDMSIVGPRPERTQFVEQFKEEIPGYMQKHMVKAGITGWAQVNGLRGDTCLKTRIEYDLWYIEHWSIALDLKIILMTITKGLFHQNAR
ncbi:MAG: undecaprenyl-phosphate glucose phosphotransferase [Thiotrichales bacterium]|jgi:putative colanic acid biosynthesis UDP-glucose lipid carrier transferase|nr:undecaprenyl-phosphate glucose phosphotransferase [Thiotrichales bacterium]